MTEVLTPTDTAIESPAYQIVSVLFDREGARIMVWVRTPKGGIETCIYKGDTATTLMRALNKADLSVKSLQRRILERLVVDGKLPAGAVTGTVD